MRLLLVAALVLTACAAPHVRKPVEEEPFVLSPGPTPSQKEEMAAKAARNVSRAASREAYRTGVREASGRIPVRGSEAVPEAFRTAGGRTGIERIGNGRRVPLVHATIAGQPTLMLVDTGAYDHLLEGWFAKSLQDAESTGKSTAIVDHANHVVTLDQLADLSFAVDGWTPLPAIRPLVSLDVNRGPRTFGIGGILSPQKLATDGPVVIDFPGNEIVALDVGAARARLAAHGVSLGTATRCGSSYLLPAKMDGHDAELLVDTGSYTTDLKLSSAPGRALSGRSSISWDVYSVGGPASARMVSDMKVTMGQFTATLDVPIVDDRKRLSRCANDGVVGMDVLGDCALMIEAMQTTIACN